MTKLYRYKQQQVFIPKKHDIVTMQRNSHVYRPDLGVQERAFPLKQGLFRARNAG